MQLVELPHSNGTDPTQPNLIPKTSTVTCNHSVPFQNTRPQHDPKTQTYWQQHQQMPPNASNAFSAGFFGVFLGFDCCVWHQVFLCTKLRPSKHPHYSPFLFSGIEPGTGDHLACNGSYHGDVEQSGEGKSSKARDVDVYIMVALNKGIAKVSIMNHNANLVNRFLAVLMTI